MKLRIKTLFRDLLRKKQLRKKEFPMDLVGQFPIPGNVLKERGFAFFQEDRQYQLDAPDQNGIVRVYSKCREVGPDEDGYGAMEYFDWWMMDTDLEPIPGVKVFYGYSPPNLFGTGMKEKWQEQYAMAVEILKNRKYYRTFLRRRKENRYMKLSVQIGEINYGDVAVKAMPLLGSAAQNYAGAVGKTIEAISQLPEELIHSLFDAIPAEQKNAIVTEYVMEYGEKILGAINKMSEEYMIGVTLSDLSLDKDLQLAATIDEIDYLCLVDKFLPMIKEKLLAMGGMGALLRPIVEKASADQLCGLLDRFVGGNKDGFVASLINQNQNRLISLIEDAAKKQDIFLKIDSVFVEA